MESEDDKEDDNEDRLNTEEPDIDQGELIHPLEPCKKSEQILQPPNRLTYRGKKDLCPSLGGAKTDTPVSYQ